MCTHMPVHVLLLICVRVYVCVRVYMHAYVCVHLHAPQVIHVNITLAMDIIGEHGLSNEAHHGSLLR